MYRLEGSSGVNGANGLEPMQRLMMRALTVSLVALVAACGGGGEGAIGDGGAPGNGSPGGGEVPVIDLSSATGRWQTGAGISPARTAIVVPATDGAQLAEAWLLAQDFSRLDVFTLLPDGSVNGHAYRFGAGAGVEPIATTAALSAAANPVTLSLAGFADAGNSLALIRLDPLDTPAVQADAAGTWVLTAGSASVSLRWTIGADGDLSGDAGSASSTGCSYSGALQALANATAYRVQFRESCPDGSTTDFGGIATLDPQGMRLTAAVSDSTKAAAAVLAFGRE